MTRRLAVLALALSTSAFAAPPNPAPVPPPPPPPVGGRSGAPGVPASLGAAMRDMGAAYQRLKAEAIDPAKLDLALKDVATMQRDAAISKLQVPPTAAKLTGADKTKALESYRLLMVGLMRSLLDLEGAMNDKKPDEIKKSVAAIDEIMKQGHAEFMPGE